ncbi:MAG: TIGR03032 family protein [Planctomycetaceae bacterium]
MNEPSASSAAPPQTGFQVLASRGFPGWLEQQQISLGVSTYQSGKLFLIGRGDEGRLSVFERTFERCMGLWSNGQTLWLASAFQLWRLENVLDDGEYDGKYDRLFVPRVGYVTGDIDVHDVAVDKNGRPVFVCTLFGCLATVGETYNFEPIWRPPFLSKLAAEDRCHLNGLAMKDGMPGYVTACSQSDVVDGWRDHRESGGCVIDVDSSEIIATGFSMPHSPRLYRDRLWLLDSGHGNFGFLDVTTGEFESLTFCPGYARGLAFTGDYAVIGVSKPRREKTFAGLPLDRLLEEKQSSARCGLQIVDLNSGDVVHWVRFEGVVGELYDVVILPNVERPKALGFKTDEIRHNVRVRDGNRTLHWTGTKKP